MQSGKLLSDVGELCFDVVKVTPSYHAPTFSPRRGGPIGWVAVSEDLLVELAKILEVGTEFRVARVQEEFANPLFERYSLTAQSST